ncbi:hypothetical protein PINS_up008678 [Pythium insidiosum]|nr:hypothetical protein PINS_up008678 [Pythium insidiosum]
MIAAMERAKEKYDRKCAEALEMTTTLRRSESCELQSISMDASGDDKSPMVTANSGGAAGQLFTKMWDTTSSFTKPSVERQRSRLESCLEDVIATEKAYIQSVDYVNAQRLVLERELTENLHAFQLTEEQRIDYLKDILLRVQNGFLKAFQEAQRTVDKLKEATGGINEFEDIEQGFRKLSSGMTQKSQVLDPSDNIFSQRMSQTHVLSDRGHNMLRVISCVLTEMMTSEELFVQSIQRLMRAHGSAPSNNSDLFAMAGAINQVSDEGSTMKTGWKVTKEHAHSMGDIHQEFRSLLAEPVSLSINMMRNEYDEARASAQERYIKLHSSLCQDTANYHKHRQKFENKSKEFMQLFSTIPDMAGVDLSKADFEHSVELMQHLSSSFGEKERRTEAKLKALAEEIRDHKTRFEDCSTMLKHQTEAFIQVREIGCFFCCVLYANVGSDTQEVDVLISAYMKNEKYRLQVEKSSLQALAKALDHMILRELETTNRTVSVLKKIQSSDDVADFIRAHRKPYEKCKKVTPVFHNSEALKVALSDFYRNRSVSPSSTASDDRKLQSSPGKRSSSTWSPSSPTSSGGPSLLLSSPPTSIVTDHKEDRSADSEESTSGLLAGATDDAKESMPLGASDFQKKFKVRHTYCS